MSNNTGFIGLVEMVGTTIIETAKHLKKMDNLENRSLLLANKLEEKLKEISDIITQIESKPHITVNMKDAKENINTLKKALDVMFDKVVANRHLQIDTTNAITKINTLNTKIAALEIAIKINTSQVKTQINQIKDQANALNIILEDKIINIKILSDKGFSNLIKSFDTFGAKLDGLYSKLNILSEKIAAIDLQAAIKSYPSSGSIDQQTTPNGTPPANSPPTSTSSGSSSASNIDLDELSKLEQLKLLGEQLNEIVTPVLLDISSKFGEVVKDAEQGWGKFASQTLMNTKLMGEYKNQISDVSAETRQSQEKVGGLFAVLHNEMGKTKSNIANSAKIGLNFAKVWDVDAVSAISSVDKISKKLGVSQGQAADIMAAAMKKYQGDINKATESVMENQNAWKKTGKVLIDGQTAYQKMVNSIDGGGLAHLEITVGKLGNLLLELWKALEPTVIKVADGLSILFDNLTAFLRAHPGIAKIVADFGALAIGVALITSKLLPLIEVFDTVSGLFGLTGTNSEKLKTIFSKLGKVLMGVFRLIKKLFGGIKGVLVNFLPMLLPLLTNPLVLLGVAIIAAFAIVARYLYKNRKVLGQQAGKIGKAIVNGLIKGINFIKKWNPISLFNKYIIKPIKKLFGINSPSKLFYKFGRWIVEGLVNGIKGAVKLLVNIFAPLGIAIKNFFNSIRRVLSRFVRSITSSLGRIRKAFSRMATSIFNSIKWAFNGIYNFIIKVMSNVWGFLSRILRRIRNFFSTILGSILNSVVTVFNSIYSKIRTTLSNAYKYIQKIFGKIGSFFIGLAKKAWDWGANIVEGIIGGIKDKVSGAVSAIKELGGKIAGGFIGKMIIRSPSRVMYELASFIPDGVRNAILDGRKRVGKATRDLGNSIKDNFIPDVEGVRFDTSNVSTAAIIQSSISPKIRNAAKKVDFKNRLNGKKPTSIKDTGKQVNVGDVHVHVKKASTDADIDFLNTALTDRINKEVRRKER
ncbi:hypothetical protein JFL43_10630 [Viridibacillus sp. YIM B01967]|uniref:Phage tail tape measure protein n=1 Tax=Viridibacillus soli TaxID=2798301 RepID=A0ABS1H7B1_9BACL|nr:hypothetical protein [Viridibacillus soli]MBK3495298.1 hypothetical protein [Viridibacillus soli]